MVVYAKEMYMLFFIKKDPRKRDQSHILPVVALSIKNK